jgi:hypothetical protein
VAPAINYERKPEAALGRGKFAFTFKAEVARLEQEELELIQKLQNT